MMRRPRGRRADARIEYQGSFGRTPGPKRPNLWHAVLIEALVVVSYRCTVYLLRILEIGREANVGVREDELVCHRRAKDVGYRCSYRIGAVLTRERRRIRNLVGVAPPVPDWK